MVKVERLEVSVCGGAACEAKLRVKAHSVLIGRLQEASSGSAGYVNKL